MARYPQLVSFATVLAAITLAATLVLSSALVQLPHWQRYGEPLWWFNLGYGLEWLGFDLAWVAACKADPALQDVHRVVTWFLDTNLTSLALLFAVLLISLAVFLSPAIERRLAAAQGLSIQQ